VSLRLRSVPEEFRKAPKPETVTATDLMAAELPPVRWGVRAVLPEGVTLLAGKPKLGKSWLALGLCVAVAAGGVALGTRQVE
jgi:RecA-family ATPase